MGAGRAGEPGPPSRNQYVVDLTNPEAWTYLLTSIDALVAEYGIDYIKWDHNRDLHEAVDHTGRPVVHNQTLALYRLIDELKVRHPGLEIESCASGGGRVDLGILTRTDRVWASDCNDPVERQSIQRWTGQLLPPELIGSHVGPERSHTTGRRTDDSFRLATALFGHAGIEQDLTACSPAEIDKLTAWAAMYKELRPLLHSGRVVRAELPDDGLFSTVSFLMSMDCSASPGFPPRLRDNRGGSGCPVCRGRATTGCGSEPSSACRQCARSGPRNGSRRRSTAGCGRRVRCSWTRVWRCRPSIPARRYCWR
ncbi:alpha-galactosidase [Kutzneria chonburiensis]|uniref:alpha-galactosidase n=1 Tax=Kutzneria chonburiensis TaxID=1483604 RepID=UPI002361BA95|nr:alpha-galactosidase [Kutzneria chonburiensis]